MWDATMLDIGREKQIFVDDLIVESVENVCRSWHQPARASENPVIFKDKPWEHITYFTYNGSQVIRDPRDGLFKCIYNNWKHANFMDRPPIGKNAYSLLYAESEDGLHWRKPGLDLHPVNGNSTNIVIPDGYGFTYLLNPHEKDRNQRFKAIYLHHPPQSGFETGGVRAAVSGDLVHWAISPDRPLMGRLGPRMDDANSLYYDEAGRFYVLNMRHYDMYAVARNLNNPILEEWSICPPYYPLDWRRVNKRRVWQTESSDLVHWSEPHLLLVPEDGDDDLDETFYGFCQFAVGSVRLGFLNTLKYVSNTLQVRLLYSRDGKVWHHTNKRQPFLSPRGEGQWDAYMVTLSHGPIEVGGELYVYHGGSSNHHDWWITGGREGLKVPEANDMGKVNYALGLAKLRQDGFVSLDAGPARRGVIITRPVISDGERLVINARCRDGGSIAVEVVNLNDEVFSGFSRRECDTFRGDNVQHCFSWKGRSELPSAERERAKYPEPEFGRFRKFRLFMENVELYSLTIA